jgi:hypothetical protein
MKYKNKKEKIHKIWFGANEIESRFYSEWFLNNKIKARLKKGIYSLHKKVYKYDSNYVTFTANTTRHKLYYNWTVQLMYIPKKFLSFIRYNIDYKLYNNTNITNEPIINSILRIDEEDLFESTVVKATLLVGAKFAYSGSNIPQLDGKLLIRIYNPEMFT